MVKPTRIKFSRVVSISSFKKSIYTFRKSRRKAEKENRRLARIEEHFRSHGLLTKGEFLEFVSETERQKKGMCDLLTFLAREEVWIGQRRGLKISH